MVDLMWSVLDWLWSAALAEHRFVVWLQQGPFSGVSGIVRLSIITLVVATLVRLTLDELKAAKQRRRARAIWRG